MLPGRAWPIKRRTRWSVGSTRTQAGRLFRTDHWTYPIYEYELKFDFLRNGAAHQEVAALIGFFDRMHGSAGEFWYRDLDFNEADTLQFGLGVTGQTQYPLAALMFGNLQPIGGVDGTPTITVNGSAAGTHSIIDDRIVSFATAPGNGAILRWTGDYFMRCVFQNEYQDFEQFAHDLVSADGVKFETVKP